MLVIDMEETNNHIRQQFMLMRNIAHLVAMLGIGFKHFLGTQLLFDILGSFSLEEQDVFPPIFSHYFNHV